jgi:hypothetical protein
MARQHSSRLSASAADCRFTASVVTSRAYAEAIVTPTKLLIGQILVVFAVIIASVWFATQWAAAQLAYQPQLGTPWFVVLSWPVYYPWRLFEWWYVYDAYAPALFNEAGMFAASGGFAGIAVAIAGSLWRGRQNRLVTTYGSSRWATTREVERAGLLRPAGVFLGSLGNHYLRHDGPEHVMAFAPTRSGKGVGLVIPTLLSWSGSAVVHDIKGENWQLTAGWRSRFSQCLLFNPTDPRSARYNPLLEVRKGPDEVRDVQNIADILVDPEGALEKRSHWEKTSHALLVGAILHVLYAEKEKTLARVATLADYVADGIVSATQAKALAAAVRSRRNLLIAGGTSSGKTTLANALLAEMAQLDERVILIEDTRELQCSAPDCVALRTKAGVVSLADLVRSTLRLRPDRIIVGEVRGAEALDMLKAWNTGHPGGIATVHANSARGALYRIEQLVQETVVSVPRRLIADAINLIVFIHGRGTSRRIETIAEVTGLDPHGDYAVKLGDVHAIGPAAESYKPADAQIASHLARFIADVRSLSIDPIVVRQNWLDAYGYATGRAALFLNEYARANDPFKSIGERSVSIQVTSVVRISDGSFQVKWTEQQYDRGSLAKTEHWTAVLSIVTETPHTAEALRRNPLGIYVNGLDWSRELSPGENL